MANALVTPIPMTAAGFTIAKASGGSDGPFMNQATSGHVMTTGQLSDLYGRLHGTEVENARLREEIDGLKSQIAKQSVA